MKNELVSKDNSLIEASYTLNMVEQRLILLAIVEARKQKTIIEAGGLLRIYAHNYTSYFSVEKHTAYEALKSACNGLFEQYFLYKKLDDKSGKTGHYKSRWVEKIGYIDGLGCVELVFSSDVIPLITRLEERYTEYELKQIGKLQSSYAIRLYELIIQWRSIGKTPLIYLNDFKRTLGLNSEYPRIESFKRKILDIAVKQINEHTDIVTSYEQVKAGRVITGFTFTLQQKKQPKDVTPESKPKPKKPIVEKQLDLLSLDVLERFNSISPEQRKAVIDLAETTLKGSMQARFKAARASSTEGLIAEFAMDINEAMMRAAGLV